MITWYRERKVRRELESLCQRAKARRDNTESNKYRTWYDYLNKDEQRYYSIMAWKHQVLTRQRGQVGSPYFSPTRDYGKDDPNSPEGFLSVDHDVSVKVEFKRDEDELIWQYENGERVRDMPVSENVLNIVEEKN